MDGCLEPRFLILVNICNKPFYDFFGITFYIGVSSSGCVYVCVFMRQRKGEILLKGLAHKELLKHLCLISVTDVTRNLELPCTQA